MGSPLANGIDAAACSVSITEFPSLTRPEVWQPWSGTWGDFVAGMLGRGVPELLAKKNGELFGPYTLADGASRENAAVRSLTLAVLDVDKAPIETMAAVLASCDGAAHLVYATHSHAPPHDCRIRVVLPLDRPVAPHEWPAVWRGVIAAFAPKGDPSCKDLSRSYFLPYRRQGAPGLLYARDGAPLSVAALTVLGASSARRASAPLADECTRTIAPNVFRDIARIWRRRGKPSDLDLADRLVRICDGISYAEPGERDTTTFRILSKILQQYPDVSRACLASLFARSVDAMNAVSPWDLAIVENKIDRIRAAVGDDKAPASGCGQLPREIALAFGDGRDFPYSPTEIQDIAQALSLAPAALRNAWILQFDSDYWLVTQHGLEPSNREALQNRARVALAPAPISLYTQSEEGARTLKPAPQLIEEFSTPLAEVRLSLAAQRSRLDVRTRSLTIATAPRRDLSPAYSDEIALWLRLLGGPDYPALEAWLAWLTELERPTSALALLGASNAGKSLLARGLSRIWTTQGAVPLKSAMGDFNADVRRCPVVFADETMPRDMRGFERTEEFRELIQSTSRLANEKHRKAVPLDGALRVLVAANNDSLLSMRAELNQADIDAIADRIIAIDVKAAAGNYLRSLGSRAYLDPHWIEGDALARHVLWLNENQRPAWVGRFGIAHDSSKLARRLAVRSGLRARISECLVRYVMDPDATRFAIMRTLACPVDMSATAPHLLYVGLDAIAELFAIVHPSQKRPDTTQIAQALQGMSTGTLDGPEGLRETIPCESLTAWLTGASLLSAREWSKKCGSFRARAKK